MATKEDLLFRQVFTLKDGARVLIRPLNKNDRQPMLDLFIPVPMEERRYMRHNINDPEIVAAWTDNIDYDKVFPLIAEVNSRIVGVASLHFNPDYAKHRAEVRIFLAKDFRGRGLGTKLMLALIEIAKRRSLYLIEVDIVRDLSNDIKAMEKVGFRTLCIFEDYFMLPNGEVRDIAHMVMRLRQPEGEF